MQKIQNPWWRRGLAAPLLALGVLMTPAAGAHADMINIKSDSSASTSQLGSFEGSIDYQFSFALNSWTVTITLTNTSAPAGGGYITGFIFNVDSSDANASATLHSATHPFTNAPNQNGSPFPGSFDAGAALGGNFQGGGSPASGIGIGATGTFVFNVSAQDAVNLGAVNFLNGSQEHDFLVRFRGFNGGGSDKVPAVEGVGPPLPGPAVLTAMALGLVMLRRRVRPA